MLAAFAGGEIATAAVGTLWGGLPTAESQWLSPSLSTSAELAAACPALLMETVAAGVVAEVVDVSAEGVLDGAVDGAAAAFWASTETGAGEVPLMGDMVMVGLLMRQISAARGKK
jgi:hypothetical protein